MTPDFRGDVAIVTGAGAGIGLTLARALAEAGARVHGFDRNAPDSAGSSGGVQYHRVDVADAAAVEAAVERVLAIEEHIDLLANVAGITRDKTLWKMSEEEWSDVISVNLTGAWHVLRAVAQPMRERRRGRIVQVASINGLRGKFGQANYSASKGGLVALTRTAARELGGRGVTVNAIAPGMIESAMTEALPPEVRRNARAESCLDRLGQPGNVADAALFLLSERAAHITGVVLAVDGGQTA
ncbi:MAG: dehydrogenase [Deltaproteobacteria bacterium]|nr:dehydrogenase [Deltaproteobacteria bacterium]